MDFQTKTRTIALAKANSIMMQARLAVIFEHFTLAFGALSALGALSIPNSVITTVN
jgi:hypothetical protein